MAQPVLIDPPQQFRNYGIPSALRLFAIRMCFRVRFLGVGSQMVVFEGRSPILPVSIGF
jgi:hypothetical protein